MHIFTLSLISSPLSTNNNPYSKMAILKYYLPEYQFIKWFIDPNITLKQNRFQYDLSDL